MAILNETPSDSPRFRSLTDVEVGRNVDIWRFVNLFGCSIGDDTMIGSFVEIQSGVTIGRRCRIQSHSFICSGVQIGDDVFVGHGVMFINDKHPSAEAARSGTWELSPVKVGQAVAIGSNATIMAGVTIGDGAVVGAGAVVTSDVESGITVVGVPARPI